VAGREVEVSTRVELAPPQGLMAAFRASLEAAKRASPREQPKADSYTTGRSEAWGMKMSGHVKPAAEAFVNALNTHNLDRIVELMSEDVTFQDSLTPQPLRGKSAFRQYWGAWLTSFPDMRVSSRGLYASGETAVDEFTVNGTHTGPIFLPDGSKIPATNRKFTNEGAAVVKVNDQGKVTSFRTYADSGSVFRQLGVKLPQ